MTKNEQREIIKAVAVVEPRGISVKLWAVDKQTIRDQFVEAVAAQLGIPLEEALFIAGAARML